MAAAPAKTPAPADDAGADQRLDKWLFFARVIKSRTLAATLIAEGKIRVNKEKVDKPSVTIKLGDVVTSAAHAMCACCGWPPGKRRGPASRGAGAVRGPHAAAAAARGADAAAGGTRGRQRPADQARPAADRQDQGTLGSLAILALWRSARSLL